MKLKCIGGKSNGMIVDISYPIRIGDKVRASYVEPFSKEPDLDSFPIFPSQNYRVTDLNLELGKGSMHVIQQ